MFTSKNFLFSKRPRLPGMAFAQSAPPASSASLVALVTRLLGKFTRRPVPGGALEHLTTLPLTAQSALVLVRFGDETLLLGATAQNVNLLLRNCHGSVASPSTDAALSGQESPLT